MQADWTVERVFSRAPSDADCDAAYLLKLSCGEEHAETMVEFAAPSAVVSAGYAQEVITPFLRNDEPPQRLVVECSGQVRVAIGPRVAAAGERPRPPRPTAVPEPQRARRRGHR